MSVDEGRQSLGSGRGRHWYVVQAQSRKEHVAAANLDKQGFLSFVPRISRTVRHARRVRTVMAPFFPRYLFVSLEADRDRWRSVNGTIGVTRIVTDGTMPIPVPHGLVEGLMEMTERLGAVSLSGFLAPGQDVRFVSGPFADTIGYLLTLDDAGRARVLLEVLGSQREISVQASILAPAFS